MDDRDKGIEKLIREQGDSLFRFCCNISENLYEAEDLFQDTLLKAMEIEDRVLGSENQRCYLIGIAIRQEKNRRRKAARRRRIAPEHQVYNWESDVLEAVKADEKSVEDRLIEMEQIRLVRNNARQLSRCNQKIASLYYGEGMKIREIAELIRLPQGTVKSRLSKIRKQLRNGLEDFDE